MRKSIHVHIMFQSACHIDSFILWLYIQGMGKGQAQSSLTTRKAYIEATYW